MKNALAELIFTELKPLQEKRKEFENNPELVDKILEESAEKCRERADKTMKEVKEKMGLI
jgi:tryptophanyl-tRNA synthetase